MTTPKRYDRIAFLASAGAEAHQALTQASEPNQQNTDLLKRLIVEQKRTNMLLGVVVYFGGGLLAGILLVIFLLRWTAHGV